MNNAIGGLTTGIIMKSHILTSHLKLKKKINFCSVPWILELLSTIHAPLHSLGSPRVLLLQSTLPASVLQLISSRKITGLFTPVFI